MSHCRKRSVTTRTEDQFEFARVEIIEEWRMIPETTEYIDLGSGIRKVYREGEIALETFSLLATFQELSKRLCCSGKANSVKFTQTQCRLCELFLGAELCYSTDSRISNPSLSSLSYRKGRRYSQGVRGNVVDQQPFLHASVEHLSSFILLEFDCYQQAPTPHILISECRAFNCCNRSKRNSPFRRT